MATRTYEYLKTTAPSSTDDDSAGYSVGDHWVDTTNDAVFRCLDTTTSSAIWYKVTAEKVVTHQAAAPTVPTPAAGDIWFETDTGLVWIYGTYAAASRWVSAMTFSGYLNARNGASAAAVTMPANIHGGYDLYIETLVTRALVQTTNDGSNYWGYTLRKVSGSTVPAASAGTSLGTHNTSAKSANAWFDLTTSIDAVVDGTGSGIEMPFIDITKTGSPGNVYDSINMVYRLVHP